MKKVLIVVDMQNDFIDGALGFEAASKVIEPIKEKIAQAREENTEIIFTFDTHSKDYLNTEEGRWLPVPHVIEGTKGHDLHPEIEALRLRNDVIFEKETFPSLDLGQYLKEEAFDEVALCGLVSSMCVFSNAIIAKAALPHAKIVVDAKATTTFDEAMHDMTLKMLEHLHIHVLKETDHAK